MRISINSKRLQICWLLCSLLLLDYLNFGTFSSAQINSSAKFNMSSASAMKHSSMSDNVYAGLDLLSAINDFAGLNIDLAGKSRGTSYKSNCDPIAAVSAFYAVGLRICSNLSQAIYSQFNSIQITTFLHKKDGMK